MLRRLTECLGRDRTKHQVAEVTSLGLVQMTRKRVGEGLLEAFSEPCEVCKGRGVIVHTEPVDKPGAAQSNGEDERPKNGKQRRGKGGKQISAGRAGRAAGHDRAAPGRARPRSPRSTVRLRSRRRPTRRAVGRGPAGRDGRAGARRIGLRQTDAGWRTTGPRPADSAEPEAGQPAS